MKKIIPIFLVILILITLLGCKSTSHTEHSFEYIAYAETHFKQYTCGCPSPEIAEVHYDHDENGECDACRYFIGKKSSGLAMGTYHLPYNSTSTPSAITFFEDGSCIINFLNDKKPSYNQKYTIKDDKVFLNIESGPKVHVFTICDNALVLDSDLTTANMWDSESSVGTVAYFLSSASKIDVLSRIVMESQGLTSLPKIKMYAEYEYSTKYTTNKVYAFMTDEKSSLGARSDKILGTKYTFTYGDAREILIYYMGRLLNLNQAYERGYISEDNLKELNENHHDCSIAHSFDEGVVSNNLFKKAIVYTCYICKEEKEVELPQDFSFSLTFGFDGYFNSEDGYLVNGYNYELDKKCETTLKLTSKELMDVYRIMYNASLFDIKDNIFVSDILGSPSYNIKISYTLNGEKVSFKIIGASFLNYYSDWETYPQVGCAYQKIVNDFIKSSKEFKSLPPNTNIYE